MKMLCVIGNSYIIAIGMINHSNINDENKNKPKKADIKSIKAKMWQSFTVKEVISVDSYCLIKTSKYRNVRNLSRYVILIL